MTPSLWLRFALRDLRSGLQGFWIFLTCLALGTAAIAIIGSLSAAIERGLDEQGQPLLGGDVEFSLIHREASPDELAYITSKGEVSKAATVRAMAVAGEATTLVEAKAIDGAYPLYGSLKLENGAALRWHLRQARRCLWRRGRSAAHRPPRHQAGRPHQAGQHRDRDPRPHRHRAGPHLRWHRAGPPPAAERRGAARHRHRAARQPDHLALPREAGRSQSRGRQRADRGVEGDVSGCRLAGAQPQSGSLRRRPLHRAAGLLHDAGRPCVADRRRRRHRQCGGRLRQPPQQFHRHAEMPRRIVAHRLRHLPDRDHAGGADRHRHRAGRRCRGAHACLWPAERHHSAAHCGARRMAAAGDRRRAWACS